MNGTQAERQKIAAVTGGTGFLGRFIVAALTQAGWKVRLLVRSEPMHPLAPDLDAEIILGDLSDQAALEKLCAGADAIIHAAGLIKAKNRQAFFAVNEAGSANLAKASAKMAPDARLVVVSSFAARAPELSDYAASKRAGEEAMLKFAAAPVAILRPSAIYGRWDKETFPLFQMASKGTIFSPGSADDRICLVSADDAAQAVAAFANNSDTSGVFEISDANVIGYTWPEITKTAGKAIKTKPRLVKIPSSLFKIIALATQFAGRITGSTPILTQGKVREILHGNWGSAVQKQPPQSLWQPKINLEDGFSRTAEWYRQQHWL